MGLRKSLNMLKVCGRRRYRVSCENIISPLNLSPSKPRSNIHELDVIILVELDELLDKGNCLKKKVIMLTNDLNLT